MYATDKWILNMQPKLTNMKIIKCKRNLKMQEKLKCMNRKKMMQKGGCKQYARGVWKWKEENWAWGGTLGSQGFNQGHLIEIKWPWFDHTSKDGSVRVHGSTYTSTHTIKGTYIYVIGTRFVHCPWSFSLSPMFFPTWNCSRLLSLYAMFFPSSLFFFRFLFKEFWNTTVMT